MISIPHFSVKNALTINLLTVFAVLAGFTSLFTIQKEAFPPVSFDLVTVQTVFPGAAPQAVEKFVTIKLEDELKSVDGIDQMTSISAQNISLIALRLDPNGGDRSKVRNDIQRAVDRAKGLPLDDIEDNPVVDEIEAAKFPIITVSLTGLPYAKLQHYAKVLEDRLLNIDDVGAVRRLGYHEPEIWVEIDPAKAHLYHVSIQEVMRAIRDQNVNLTGGDLSSRDGQLNIRTDGEFETPDEIGEIIIRSNDLGQRLRVSDIARVSHSFEEDEILYATNGTESINLMCVKKVSGDVIQMVDEIKRVVSEFEEEAPPELKTAYVDDYSYLVRRRLRVLMNNGLQGAFLILILLFIVLAPPIAATAALDIPVTFLITFAVMKMLGMTVNLMTLFGMIMVIGMIVDDAIIMAENVFRHIEKGGDPRQAAIEGGEEVMRPVTAAILTSMCAYLPLAFMSGIIGQFVRSIPIVVTIALVISWITTIFAIPTHAAEFTILSRYRFQEGKRHWFDHVRNGYMFVLKKAIDFRYMVAVGITSFVVFTIFVAAFFMKFVLFTSEGIDEFFIRVETSLGTPVEETFKRLKPISDILHELPKEELQNFITEAGVSREDAWDPQTQYGSHQAQIRVFLTPYSDRKRDALEITNELEEKFKNIKGFDSLRIDKIRPGPPVGKAVEAKIRGDDFETIQAVAKAYKDFLATLPGATNIDDDYEPGKGDYHVVLDRQRMARARLSFRDVAQEVRHAFEGGIATTIQKSDEEIDVRVKFHEEKAQSLEDLEKIFVPNAAGNLIPLSEIASFEKRPSVVAIKRFDRKRMITVTADADEDITTSLELNRKIEEHFKNIRARYPGIDVVYAGEREKTQESLLSLLIAFVAAMLLMFCIIAIQFRSLVQPPIVMLTIPLGLVGVVWALFLHGMPFNFLSIMGFIGLSGVVVNDSIVMIDFMNKLRRKGMERRESIFEACRSRFRAIFMASLTTVAGTMPMAYGWGGDDPFIRPMALAFTWGMACASSITLFAIPCFYAIVDDISVKIFKHPTVKLPYEKPPLAMSDER